MSENNTPLTEGTGNDEGQNTTNTGENLESSSEVSGDRAANQGSDSQGDDKGKQPEEGSRKPVEYTDFTLPEGFHAEEGLMGEFKDIAKELNLSQENAQKLVDLQTKFTLAQAENWETVKSDWVKAAKSDEEIGRDKWDENVATARQAIDQFGSDELKAALDSTGVGNHPEFIRFAFRVGKALKEDGILSGSNRGESPRDPAKILFPDMN